MAEKNRQHYVPQFYLRNFSTTARSISTFHIVKAKYIPNASIKDMCQKHNFYGSDNEIENFLDKEIERKAAIILKGILETDTFPRKSTEEYRHLIRFLLVSEGRNLKFADSNNNMVDFIMKTILKNRPEFKDADLDDITIGLKQSAILGIQLSLEMVPVLMDLKPLLIIEKTGARKFITSDNPLVRYNSFYVNKGYESGFGYPTRGIQLFFPISPEKCILLYDQRAYDIPDENNGILILKKAREVDKINDLLYLNAYNNVFFNQITKSNYVEKIHAKNMSEPKTKELDREISIFQSFDTNKELLQFSRNSVRKNINFSWIKISGYANSLEIPDHIGGIHRTESPFIRNELNRREEEAAKHQPSFNFEMIQR
ncbi:DUF4238 domain-containing protein [Bacillus sp. BD59S]|uniref:DUF4238 domain-containing protein n=1 Tax=Bacillus sp. BD59S TaxID=2499213 RepID=UPI00117F04C6|nr:DUF4238 domain-containing protein [Bacillus sp. BD59S]QDQ03599.1 DUF4238 domain-containing protein [Bacillus sp. BD59S]